MSISRKVFVDPFLDSVIALGFAKPANREFEFKGTRLYFAQLKHKVFKSNCIKALQTNVGGLYDPKSMTVVYILASLWFKTEILV